MPQGTFDPWCGYRDGIVIPGVVTIRLPDEACQLKVRGGARATRYDRTLYIAAGMNGHQWRHLRPVERRMIRYAYLLLTATSNVGREPDPVDWQAFKDASSAAG